MHFWIFFAAAVLPLVLAHGAAYDDEPAWHGLPGNLYTEQWATCPDASWPPTSIGQRLQPQEPDAELEDILAAIDPNRVEHIISKLASFGTRHTLSTQNSSTEGIGAARDWIYHEMQNFASSSDGNMEVYFNSYIQGIDGERITFPVKITNVVAQINGTDDPNRVYVVSGHYDSRRIDVMDYTNEAPGADDDASGVAVAMEMARVCAKKRPKATMIFAAVSAEEQGLYGSAHLAKTLKRAGYNVEGHWNNDIVGTGKNEPFSPINDYTIRLFGASVFYPNSSTAEITDTAASTGGWNDSPAQNLGRYISEIAAGAWESVGMQVALIYRPDRFLRGGDHLSFLEQGFPGVRFTEAVENFAHQHQNTREQDGIQYGDLIEFVDFDYTARVARTNLASMWSAANAPRMPVNVSISQAIGFPATDKDTPPEIVGNDSQFCWSTGNDPLAVGYELVWRPTGNLQWTHSLDVGNVRSVTVNLPKDDLQFGVRAVGEDGKKSPAVLPLPAESC
ncbi:hypothetical protein LTR37_012147 [Vermiconidia calcicola]|uniref:Uncharacterized protein n=1 Tax=Vermiconidia calcicola TaxID=1690605 RepID=A0ACC3N1Y0_9PEZI|nr:hypothetical protein LTR37_012147 [Vermiconidia calcicola]